MKLKRVVSQKSIDSISNYSSQQKRENLRYRVRSNEDESFENNAQGEEKLRKEEQQIKVEDHSCENNSEAQMKELNELKQRMGIILNNYTSYIKLLESKVQKQSKP